MTKSIKISFVLISTVVALVLLYYWKKPEGYCEFQPSNKCSILWCKKVKCNNYTYESDGSFSVGECVGPTVCSPRW